jgi:predicted Zn-dependent protease
MNKKDVWLLAAIVVIAVILGLTLTTILQQKKSTSAIQEADKIAEIDRLLANGIDRTAVENIEALARKDLSAASYIRLLKRAWQISRRTTNYDLYNDVSQAALKAYPARADLNALRIYGLLREGRTKAAVDIYNESEIETEEWPDLTSEISLYAETAATGKKEALSKNSRAEDFLSMYRTTGSYGFLLDAVLLLLRRGEVQSAYSTVSEEAESETLPPDFMFLLAFDAAKWQHAQTVLADQPQIFNKIEYQFLKADIFMYQNQLYMAAELYEKLLENETQLTTTLKSRALLNILYIYDKLETPIPSYIIQLVMDISMQDPEDSALLFAGFFLSHNSTDRAQKVLDASAEGSQESVLRQVIQEGTGQRVNPERYKSLLWRLVYRTEQERYARYLAWFLIGIEDIQGLQSLTDHSRQAFGNQSWIQFYEAVVLMYSRQYVQAAETFKSSFSEEPHWEYLYNAAIAYSVSNDLSSALDELKAAEAVVPAGSPGNAAVLAEQIELHIQSNRFTEARTKIAILENRFPHNMKVGLLKSLLEARLSD